GRRTTSPTPAPHRLRSGTNCPSRPRRPEYPLRRAARTSVDGPPQQVSADGQPERDDQRTEYRGGQPPGQPRADVPAGDRCGGEDPDGGPVDGTDERADLAGGEPAYRRDEVLAGVDPSQRLGEDQPQPGDQHDAQRRAEIAA